MIGNTFYLQGVTEIGSTITEYYLSTSSIDPIGGDWSADRPTVTRGFYLFMRTVTTLTDGSFFTSAPVNITGEPGSKGAQMEMKAVWIEGETYYEGADGEDYFTIMYYNGSMYLCTKTHVAEYNPQYDVANHLGNWSIANEWLLVIAKIIKAQTIVSEVFMSYNANNQLTASMNRFGSGEYIMYYPDTGNRMLALESDGYIRYYMNDEYNTVKWQLGMDGVINNGSIDAWVDHYMISTNVTGTGLNTVNLLGGVKFKRFVPAPLSIYGNYNGLVAIGSTLDSALPTTATKISDGWYCDSGVPQMEPMEQTESRGIYYRELCRYSNGYIAEIKTIRFYEDGTILN